MLVSFSEQPRASFCLPRSFCFSFLFHPCFFFQWAAARFIFPFLSFSRSFQAQASNPKPQTRTPNPSLCSLDRFTVSPFDELRPLLLYSYLLVRCVLFACPLLLLGRCMPGREEFVTGVEEQELVHFVFFVSSKDLASSREAE